MRSFFSKPRGLFLKRTGGLKIVTGITTRSSKIFLPLLQAEQNFSDIGRKSADFADFDVNPDFGSQGSRFFFCFMVYLACKKII